MRDKLFLILCTLLLLILFFYSSSSDDTVAAPDMPQTASWFDRLIGNDYDLLHSNKYGEPHDTNWKMRLVRKIQVQEDIYDPDPYDYYGGDINGNWKYH